MLQVEALSANAKVPDDVLANAAARLNQQHALSPLSRKGQG
jgi:hypothetical protein